MRDGPFLKTTAGFRNVSRLTTRARGRPDTAPDEGDGCCDRQRDFCHIHRSRVTGQAQVLSASWLTGAFER